MAQSYALSFLSTVLSVCYLWTLCNAASISPLNPSNTYLNDVSNELPEQLNQIELIEPKYLQFTQDVPKTTEVLAGSSLTLKCGANGIPPPNIHWLKDGRRIHQGAHENEDNLLEQLMNVGLVTLQNGVTMSKLKLDCVTKRTAGVYQCVAENGDQKLVSPPAFIDILDAIGDENSVSCKEAKRTSYEGTPPEIYLWTDSRLERNGASAQLFCRARGEPAPKVLWSNENGEELTDSDRFTILHNGDLIVKSVDWDVAGQYTCAVVNEFGVDSVDTYLYPTLAVQDELSEAQVVDNPL